MINIVNHNLKVPFVTPGGVPGVLEQPVVQTSGFISAVANDEHGVVYAVSGVKNVIRVKAIICIDDTTRVGVDILIIGCNSDGKRPFLKCLLQISICTWNNLFMAFDGNVGSLGSRVEAIGRVVTTNS